MIQLVEFIYLYIIEFALVVTAILSIRLKTESMLAVLFFSLLCLIFSFEEQYIENNHMYYVFACLIDLVIIEILSRISKPTLVVISIQTICRWFIYANLLGFIIYEFELPAIIYTILCGSLYIAALLSTFFQGGSGGIYRNNNLHSGFYPRSHTSHIALQQNEKAIRN